MGREGWWFVRRKEGKSGTGGGGVEGRRVPIERHAGGARGGGEGGERLGDARAISFCGNSDLSSDPGSSLREVERYALVTLIYTPRRPHRYYHWQRIRKKERRERLGGDTTNFCSWVEAMLDSFPL